MEKALLVTVRLKNKKDNLGFEDMAQELEELTATAGAEAFDNITCLIEKPTANLFIGRGKAEEISLLAQEEKIDTIIFNSDLTGTQHRNLEDMIGRKVVDRTQLILDIFAKHARSPEGKMQVELAQLQYLLPRLIGKGLILSRTGGGIGTSGPGETRLEVDRRRIRKKIDSLKEDLKHYSLHRKTMRKKRQENTIPTVALVGYTNAGKSTLINALTQGNQSVSDSLFTTLDTASKALQLPGGENIILSDTVGFLRDLPHHLIEAFKATLEEVVEADLLIHVLDVNHARLYEHANAVFTVLKELGADQKPMITALNKIDLLDDPSKLDRLKMDFNNPVLISAKLKDNLEQLLEEIQKNFLSRMADLDILVQHSRMDLVDLFYREGKVKDIQYAQEGVRIKVSLPKILAEKLLHSKDIALIRHS